MINKLKIIFFGTSEFAVPALEALVKSGFDVSAVITAPDEPSGRKLMLTSPPIKIAAEKLGLPIYQPEKLKSNEDLIDKLFLNKKCEIGAVVSYGKIIPDFFINSFKYGILNVHPSLLPKYRGPSPIQTQILNGETETGVTIIKIDDQVDHGPILMNQRLNIKNQNYGELHDELAEIGAKLLVKILPDYIAGKIQPVEQDHSQATFTKKITNEDGRIDWKKSIKHIYNQFRAFSRWPGVWTTWNGKKLKITNMEIVNNRIEILRLQLEGGKEMPLKEFIVGHRDFVGSKLG